MIIMVLMLGHDPYDFSTSVVHGAFCPEPYQAAVEGLYEDIIADRVLRRVYSSIDSPLIAR